MRTPATRRGFLQTAVTAGGCLVTQGLSAARQPAQVAAAASGTKGANDRLPGNAMNAPVVVVTQAVSTDVHPRARAWVYIVEILQRAGLFFEHLSPEDLPSLPRRAQPIVVLAGDLRLTAEQHQALDTSVKSGGSIVGIGGMSGLDEIFGVSGRSPVAEGWLKVSAPDHPVMAGLRSSLHVFGGFTAKTGSAATLAELDAGNPAVEGSAIVENRWGKGRALLMGPDLIFSIVHMQQGLPVLQDGRPAPDGSAAINDGVLKAEDGLVLDWQRDRHPMRPDGVPVFIEPVSDELREIILRGVFYLARQQGVSLPALWYWPRGLDAVGLISHDTDQNEPDKAAALLEVMNRCRVKSTWCILYPGGYPREFYRRLQGQGFEIGLHYDAMTGGPRTSWSRDNFVLQHRWLVEETGLHHIATNKNHYTRWESRLDFFRWCEELGVNSDQTRGPSKQGTIGFPLGGSQPYFPLDDERDSPRFLPVLEINMLTQDLVVVCPPEYGTQLVDSVVRHHGVAHFLFHPAHILKPSVSDTLMGLVNYGRAQGLEWWTSEQICQWEVSRRGVKATFDAGNRFTLHAARPLRDAVLLVLKTRPAPTALRINGRAAPSSSQTWHGFEFDAIPVDVAGEVKVQTALAPA